MILLVKAAPLVTGGEDGDRHGCMPRTSTDGKGALKRVRRLSSYANFLDENLSDIAESDEDEERMVLLEDSTDGHTADEYRTSKGSTTAIRCLRKMKSPSVVVPTMMIVDLILGVSLSLYDSNLLRNVPGFRFPLVYAFTQKLTNALASLVLICLSRRWEGQARESRRNMKGKILPEDEGPLMELPSVKAFRQHLIPLSAVALVQTISAAFANKALQVIPLPLFKVCLMCGPIFVAFITSIVEGQLYSKGRMFALSLIGIGACRAVYSEAEGADNPRYIMQGAMFALGASAFGGISLVLSSVLMHNKQEEDEDQDEKTAETKDVEVELNPLSLLFYLSCEQVLMLSGFLCLQQGEEEGGGPGEFAAFTIYFAENPTTAIFYLMTGSMMALCLAVLTFVLVNRTSPVAASLLGNVRSISTVAISSALSGNTSGGGLFGSGAFVGYSLTLAGGVAYAVAALDPYSSK